MTTAYAQRKHDAWVDYVEAVKDYEWYATAWDYGWNWCFSLPTGQRFCKNLPVWAQIELGIPEKDRVTGWNDPCVEEES